VAATAWGIVFLGALSLIRARWMSFPLNPIGYALASAYGDLLWFPFLIVWLLKTVILRYGGGRVYAAALPFFLGLTLGQFLSAGVVWGGLAAIFGGPFLRWKVWFG
jgi:hypothetical protein